MSFNWFEFFLILNLPKSMRFPEEGCVQKVAKVRQLTKIKGKTTIFRSNQDTRLMLKSTLIAGQGSSKSKNFCLFWLAQLSNCHFREKNKLFFVDATMNRKFNFSVVLSMKILKKLLGYFSKIEEILPYLTALTKEFMFSYETKCINNWDF
jgi:hypothetical protein